ncbi:MAG: DUF3068 domain-containing protein [Gordonia sp. (in: high G+C Gram-positive bacteria)]|uniref:DUF3068 domain-containing protein n=1 Tax=Gordonia sp. (in: high G+C Gram-positive bacteria) TaxID=84139 RepID=UPI0039E256A1
MPDAQTSRWSTRQLLPPTLVFLAALLATVAIASPLFLAPQLARVSLDTSLVAISTSTEPIATLDRCSLDRPRAAMLAPGKLIRSQRVVAVRPADRHIATLQAGTVIRRDDNATGCADPVQLAVVDRVTVRRTTAAPTGESSIQTDSNRPAVVLPQRDGVTYLFAPGFNPDGQRFFDPITRRTVDLNKLGRDTVAGRSVTKLRADIPDTDLAALPDADPRTRIVKPGSWFGWPGASVEAHAFQGGSYTLSVDEQSGLIIDAQIVVHRDYRAGDRRLSSFAATFRYDAKTRESLADAARSQARPGWLAGRIIPLLAALGALVAAAGAWALRRSAGDQPLPLDEARSLQGSGWVGSLDEVRETR